MEYTIYRAAGWHGEPEDPVVGTTDDREEAALIAGERIDIRMPGDSSPHSSYVLDEDGELVDPIESYRCDRCGELFEWGDGPNGAMDGEILECPDAAEAHLVTWVCDECSSSFKWPGD